MVTRSSNPRHGGAVSTPARRRQIRDMKRCDQHSGEPFHGCQSQRGGIKSATSRCLGTGVMSDFVSRQRGGVKSATDDAAGQPDRYGACASTPARRRQTRDVREMHWRRSSKTCQRQRGGVKSATPWALTCNTSHCERCQRQRGGVKSATRNPDAVRRHDHPASTPARRRQIRDKSAPWIAARMHGCPRTPGIRGQLGCVVRAQLVESVEDLFGAFE